MHLRSSQSRGIHIVDDGTQQTVGLLTRPLIDPDTGRVLGFFVFSTQMGASELFLQSADIVAWGTRVHIRSEDCLSPPDELIRMKKALEDPRPVIGQPIRIMTTKRYIGLCGDIQFSTRHFMTEWIFPRRFFFARQPLPMTDVIEITPEAIWIRDPLRPSNVEVLKAKDERAVSAVLTDVASVVRTIHKS